MKAPSLYTMKNAFLPGRLSCLLVPLLFAGSLLVSVEVNAQLTLERELVGSAVGPATIISGNPQELLVDASLGEQEIGFVSDNIKLTVGFQQPTKLNATNNENVHREELPEEDKELTVSAYPNPTIERLTVELGEKADTFESLSLMSAFGRSVAQKRVSDVEAVVFEGLNGLPNGKYLVYGTRKNGSIEHLATVMVVNQ